MNKPRRDALVLPLSSLTIFSISMVASSVSSEATFSFDQDDFSAAIFLISFPFNVVI